METTHRATEALRSLDFLAALGVLAAILCFGGATGAEQDLSPRAVDPFATPEPGSYRLPPLGLALLSAAVVVGLTVARKRRG